VGGGVFGFVLLGGGGGGGGVFGWVGFGLLGGFVVLKALS